MSGLSTRVSVRWSASGAAAQRGGRLCRVSAQKQRTQWTESRARRELADWQRSGETMAAFARKRGYPAHRLSSWRRRLAPPAAAEPAESLALAPAVITGTQRAPVVMSVGRDAVHLEIDDPAAVHPSWLAALAAALRREVSA